jgi:hypothetical protein
MVEYFFLAMVTGGVAWAARSIDKLNKNIAMLLERSSWHERELEDHSHRIGRLENKKK